MFPADLFMSIGLVFILAGAYGMAKDYDKRNRK
jgi:hypothetical protein